MFGWVIVTGKKIIIAALIALLIYYISPALGFSQSDTLLITFAFLVGMAFPDLDMITSFFRQALHATAIFLFLFALIVIALYPASIQISGDLCSESITSAITGMGGLGIYCNAGTVLIFMGVSYFLARLVVGWLPEGYILHSYVMAVLVVICAALFSLFAFGASMLAPMVVVFSTGYILHMSIDAGYHHLKN